MIASTPETSIIIRTFNEAKYLPALLESLGQQTYRDFEIVVIDSGSLDGTREIAANYADTLLRIDSHDFTFGFSLNVGIDGAKGKYSVLVSAHTLPVDNEWLERLVRPLNEDGMAMSFGRQVGWSTSKFSEVQDLRRTFGKRRQVLHPPNFFAHNANSAIRNDLWREHRFDEALPGLEDIEWAKHWMLQGHEVVYEPAAALHHIHEEKWSQIQRRYYREAVAAHSIGVKRRVAAFIEPVKETALTLVDLSRIFSGTSDQDPLPGTPASRSKEIVLFRFNKAWGTMKGLLAGELMQDPTTRESFFFDRTCQAVVVHGPGKSTLESVRIPEIKPGEVLIRMAYCGVSGTDIEVVDGERPGGRHTTAEYPLIPGREVSGHVVTPGINVSHLEEDTPVAVEGIQVCGTCEACGRSNWNQCSEKMELGVTGQYGGYSQNLVVPSRFVHRLPKDLDLRKATLCEPLAVILKGLSRIPGPPVESSQERHWAIVGAGSLGHLCAKVLAHQGQRVTVFDQDLVRRGYFEDTDIETSDDLDRISEFDVLVELTGDQEALKAMLHKSAAGAVILLLGLPYSHKEFSLEGLVANDKTVVGSTGSSSVEFCQAIQLLPELDLDLYIQSVLPLADFQEGWRLFRQRKNLKVLLSGSDEGTQD